MIELQSISKTFEARGETHQALRDVSLTIEDGDVFGIIGASGAGKSTLVRCINLLERPTGGRVVVNGADVTDYQGSELRRFRENVGMIFQNFSLFQQRTVLSNVMFPLTIRRVPRKEAERRALELLELVGLPEKASRYPSELSGGQQQRVAIARALVVITHSLQVAQQICNRIAVIDDGRIVEEGLTQDVFAHPKSDVTRDLLRHAVQSGEREAA